MDEDSANVFISTLVKNIQMLCYGHVAFNQNVEVIGHLYINIDSGKKLNYVVNEKCSKLNESTTFTSNSFHAEPKTAQEKKKATETGYINHVAAASMGNWQARSRKKKITSARSFVESPAKIPKISEPIDLHLTTDVADSIDESLGVTFPSQDTYTNDSDDGNGPSSDYSNFKVKTEAIENDLTAAHSLSSIKIENVSSLEGGGGDESFHASSSAFNPNDSSSQLYSPVRTDYDDFPMAAAKSVLNVSGFPAQEVLYSKDPSIQPLLGNIIKEASIQCGIWEDAPYPRDIPMPIREMFFDFVLSLAPQLDAYRDMIWSKLAHRLRDRRFKKKLKTQRGLKTD